MSRLFPNFKNDLTTSPSSDKLLQMFHQGKVALVTGGSRGIGRAIALRLASDGADVMISFFTNRTRAKETLEEIRKKGVRGEAVRGNVGDPEHILKIFNAVREKFGRLDIFISNAATGVLKPILDFDLKDWERMININARALLLGAQEAAKLMEGRGGRIISITSIGSTRWIPQYGMLGTSKAAIESLTRYLAVELAPKKIIVNAVSAGIVDTDSLKFFPDREMMLERTKRLTPVGRVGEPEDIAKVVVMLCSEDASWICGQTIVADGGYALLG